MSDKKISPKEAAMAVLKKAEELYKASSLAKSEKPMQKDGQTLGAAIGFPGAAATAPSAPPPPPPMGKGEEANPDEKADAALGEQVEEAVHQHEASSEHPGQHADGSEMKGHIKLAKFMGRMAHKKEQKAKMNKGY